MLRLPCATEMVATCTAPRVVASALSVLVVASLIPFLIFVGPTVQAKTETQLLWLDQFGTPRDDWAYDITADGIGVYVAGMFGWTGQPRDSFVRRYTHDGSLVWSIHLDDESANATASAISSLEEGGVLVAGSVNGTIPGQQSIGVGPDAFIIGLDVNGSIEWVRQFGTSAHDGVLGLASDGTAVYVTGWTEGALEGQAAIGGRDAFIQKYSLSGALLWTRQFGSGHEDAAHSVAVDTSGIYVVGQARGTIPGATGDGSAFVRRYDSDGNEVWTLEFDVADTHTIARDVALRNGGVYVVGSGRGPAGEVTGPAFVRKYDAGGNEVWTRQFEIEAWDSAWEVAADASGVYVVGRTAGAFPGYENAGGYDAYMRMYTHKGEEAWTFQYGTQAEEWAFGVAAHATGVYVAGSTWGVFPGKISLGGLDAFTTRLGIPTVGLNSDSIDFGRVNVGSMATANVTVLSLGSAPLTVKGMSWDIGTQGFALEISPAMPVVIPPGGTVVVTVVFAPTIEGIATDILRIETDDPEAAIKEIAVSGTGVASSPPFPLPIVAAVSAGVAIGIAAAYSLTRYRRKHDSASSREGAEEHP